MLITATHINLFHVCKRELWLHANGIRMEHTSETVAEGKLIGETTYQDRATQYTEVEIDGVKIDFYDAKNKIVHEVKKSDSVSFAHKAQVLYYLYKLINNGVTGVSGIIEYPKLRQTEVIEWKDEYISTIMGWENDISDLVAGDKCPPVINSKICKSCSYADFCYVEEGL